MHAQVTLNPSEDWTCHFTLENNDWLSVGPSYTAPTGGANGQFIATLNSDLQAGTVLRCELYEGLFWGAATDGKLISTILYTSAPPNTVSGWVSDLWQDMEGTIRFTALNGPVTIQQIDVETDHPYLSAWFYYYLTLVPPALPPRLSISPSSGSVRLSWWTNVSSGYVLETAKAAAGTTWSQVQTTPTISNAQKIVTVSTNGNDSSFFRLRK